MNQSDFASHQEFMIRLFQKAIPEISDQAILFYVHDNPYIFPGTGNKIELKQYSVPGFGPSSSFEFTIAHIKPERMLDLMEVVLVLEYELGEYPGHKFYIKEVSPAKDPPHPP